MLEMTIYGRGGQGGVTLAKLIATTYFLRGQHVQAFGVYAAERSGAPLQAYVRCDDCEITNHNQVRHPDLVIVLDRTLIGRGVLAGLKPGGTLILNTPDAPESLGALFSGWRVACIDATAIAVANGLGTRAVPIVNTTMLGAVARALDLPRESVEAALAEARFGAANVSAVRTAFDSTSISTLPGPRAAPPPPAPAGRVADLLDDDVGGPPRIRTGAWANRRPHRQTLTPPCNNACPAGNDVQAFVAAMARQDHDAALGILLRTSPFPGTCGRVCPAPCMASCNRNEFDEPVNVRELERYAEEHGRRPQPPAPVRPERVAVVGSGPAGLSATYHLTRLGYRVELFESADELGGVMRTGIPAYRLPREVLDREIAFVVGAGVTAHVSHRVGRAELLALSHLFDAVFVATGLQSLTSIQLSDEAEGVVSQGIDFLDRARRGQESLSGADVIVVGGGNTAMDAARTALRLGARRVRIIYRRTRAEMPAIAEEIREAIEEGVELAELVAPLRLRRVADRPVLTCNRMKLGEPDQSGRRRPIPDDSPDAKFELECDRVILALGQSADLSILPAGSAVNDGQRLLGLTGAPVFAGGDFATNEGTVAAAIGSGRRAALHIHRTLAGEDLLSAERAPVAGPDQILLHVFEHVPQRHGGELPPSVRTRGFVEVRRGFAEGGDSAAASIEAARCFSCGVCNSCDRCVEHCPEGILRRDRDGYHFDYDYCKGCGVCATECPRGVIYMAEL